MKGFLCAKILFMLVSVGLCVAIPSESILVRAASIETKRTNNLCLRGGGNLGPIRPRDGLAVVHVVGTLNGLQCALAPKVQEASTNSKIETLELSHCVCQGSSSYLKSTSLLQISHQF